MNRGAATSVGKPCHSPPHVVTMVPHSGSGLNPPYAEEGLLLFWDFIESSKELGMRPGVPPHSIICCKYLGECGESYVINHISSNLVVR